MTAGVRVTWHGDKIRSIEREAVWAGLDAAADLFFAATQLAVPVASGRLKRSGRVEINRGKLRLEIHYGEGLDYGTIEHEKTELDHHGGQAKYVEQPMRALAGAAGRLIALEIRRRMMLGGR